QRAFGCRANIELRFTPRWEVQLNQHVAVIDLTRSEGALIARFDAVDNLPVADDIDIQKIEDRVGDFQQPGCRIGLIVDQLDPKPEGRSEEHTSELQSRENLVCRLLLEKKKKK